VEAAIYYCVAEAIQNTTKHAGTGARVAVSLERLSDKVSFAVIDDGLGFGPGPDGSGIGLVSMRDRLGAVGGELEIVSSRGGGTTVRGRVPA
jgi:signal transduction histidine kinase